MRREVCCGNTPPSRVCCGYSKADSNSVAPQYRFEGVKDRSGEHEQKEILRRELGQSLGQACRPLTCVLLKLADRLTTNNRTRPLGVIDEFLVAERLVVAQPTKG